MKKILSLILCVLMIEIAIPFFAFNVNAGTTEDGFSYTANLGEVTINGWNSESSSLVIPETINGLPVTCIGYFAFNNDTNIREVTIPSTVKKIRVKAFYGCSNISDVYISDLTAWCHIDFTDEYSNPLTYADNLYVNGEKLKNLVIPDGTEKIEDYAFGYLGLWYCYIPDSVKYVGTDSLYEMGITFYEGTSSEWRTIKGDRCVFFYDYLHNTGDVGSDYYIEYRTFYSNISILEEEMLLYETKDDGTIEIIGYIGEKETVNMPASINQIPVHISWEYYGEDTLKTIYFNGTEKELGKAFSGGYSGSAYRTFKNQYEIVFNSIPVEGIILAGGEDSITLRVGESFVANYEIYPENANGVVTFSTSNSCVSISGKTIRGVRAGEATVTMTAESGVSYSFKVKVIGCVGIEVARLPDKVNYSTRQPLDITGIVINKVYNDGTKVETASFTYSGYNALKKGVQTITVTSGSYTTQFQVYTSDATVGDIDLDGNVTGMDSNCMRRIVAGGMTPEEQTDEFFVCDLNGDGAINGVDSALLRRMIAG